MAIQIAAFFIGLTMANSYPGVSITIFSDKFFCIF